MILIVKTPGSQMGSPATAEEGGEAMGGGRGESGGSSEVHERLSVTSTAPKARSRSRGVTTLDEAPRMLLRMSSKFPTLAPRSAADFQKRHSWGERCHVLTNECVWLKRM